MIDFLHYEHQNVRQNRYGRRCKTVFEQRKEPPMGMSAAVSPGKQSGEKDRYPIGGDTQPYKGIIHCPAGENKGKTLSSGKKIEKRAKSFPSFGEKCYLLS
jgi:hypothetical protein